MARVRDARNRSEQEGSQSDATQRQAERAQAARNEAARARATELTALPTGGRATQAGVPHLGELATNPQQRISAPARSRGFASVLRNRYFLRLWMAQLISQTALNAANFGLIILIQTQVKSFTATSGAIVMFALPAIIFGAPAGVLVDRLDRRTVLWVSNVLRAAVSALFVFSLLADQSALIPAYALAFLLATISQFFAPAEGATIPLLVHQDELINALALFNVTFTLAQVAGLIILGPLIFLLVPTFTIGTVHHHTEIVPSEVLFAILSVLYLICAGLILLIPHSKTRTVARGRVPTAPLGRGQAPGTSLARRRRESRQIRGIWTGMKECWHYIRRDRHLLVAVFQLAFAGSFIAVIAMIAPQFVTDFFNRPPAAAALVFVPAGVGLVIGSALVPRIARRLGYTLTVFIGVVTLAISSALLPLVRAIASSPTLHIQNWYYAWPYVALILLLTFIIGVALDLINVPAQTILQERAPDWIKGRVLAVQALLLNAVTIPFVLIMGRIADIAGLMTAIEVLAIIISILGLGSVYFSLHGPEESATSVPLEDQETVHGSWHGLRAQLARHEAHQHEPRAPHAPSPPNGWHTREEWHPPNGHGGREGEADQFPGQHGRHG
jgi:MFS family permease